MIACVICRDSSQGREGTCCAGTPHIHLIKAFGLECPANKFFTLAWLLKNWTIATWDIKPPMLAHDKHMSIRKLCQRLYPCTYVAWCGRGAQTPASNESDCLLGKHITYRSRNNGTNRDLNCEGLHRQSVHHYCVVHKCRQRRMWSNVLLLVPLYPNISDSLTNCSNAFTCVVYRHRAILNSKQVQTFNRHVKLLKAGKLLVKWRRLSHCILCAKTGKEWVPS